MATHSSILAFRIPWTEDPDGVQSTGSERVRHDRDSHTHTSIGRRAKPGAVQRVDDVRKHKLIKSFYGIYCKH